MAKPTAVGTGGKPMTKNTMGGKASKGVKATVKEGADHKSIHPKYEDSTITCLCGNVIHTRSTKQNIRVEICSRHRGFFAKSWRKYSKVRAIPCASEVLG